MLKTASIILSFALAATGGVGVVAPNANTDMDTSVNTAVQVEAQDDATLSAQQNALVEIDSQNSQNSNDQRDSVMLDAGLDGYLSIFH